MAIMSAPVRGRVASACEGLRGERGGDELPASVLSITSAVTAVRQPHPPPRYVLTATVWRLHAAAGKRPLLKPPIFITFSCVWSGYRTWASVSLQRRSADSLFLFSPAAFSSSFSVDYDDNGSKRVFSPREETMTHKMIKKKTGTEKRVQSQTSWNGSGVKKT